MRTVGFSKRQFLFLYVPVHPKSYTFFSLSFHFKNFKVFDLLDLLGQVADGMHYVSKKGTVHRDLRAVNCMYVDFSWE